MINYSFSIANFEYFLLILVRIASFVYIAPFFGDNAVPARVKTGLSAFVALFMYNIIERPQLSYVSAVGFAVLVVKEGITGLLIGFAANICNSIVIFAGNLIDMDIGLSMATEFNPSMNSETTVTGNFYYYVVLVLLLVSDMHTYLIRAVCDSFSVVPLGGAQFQFDNMLSTMTKYMGDMFVIGFRIFLPVFACMMIMNCILGIMAKVAPQMNMFSVGILKSSAIVRQRYRKENMYFLAIELINNLEKIQRRQFFRLPCTIDMDFYEVRYDDKAESELEFCKKMYKNHAINSKNMNTVKSVILDISGGGIRFSLSTPLEEGTYFMAQFSLALEECTQQFNIVCKVINCTQSLDYADRYFARSKFIFDRMTEREKIVRFVFEEERRIRRREME